MEYVQQEVQVKSARELKTTVTSDEFLCHCNSCTLCSIAKWLRVKDDGMAKDEEWNNDVYRRQMIYLLTVSLERDYMITRAPYINITEQFGRRREMYKIT